jgi:hypothetical protein
MHVKTAHARTCYLPAGRLDCFLAGAIATIYTHTNISTHTPTLFFPANVEILYRQHTLGLANACWFNIGLRSIEGGTRARAALLNITGESWEK